MRSATKATGEPYLTGRDKLQGPKGSLQVLCVALQVEESAGDRSLQLGGVLPRWRVVGDLVDSSHDCRRATGSWLYCWCCFPCREGSWSSKGKIIEVQDGVRALQFARWCWVWDRSLGASLSGTALCRVGLASALLGECSSRDFLRPHA
jgi:hypothetical protein